MRQRVVIAIAIANQPEVIIADEPTTALDVTVQAQVLEVLKTAQDETGAATVLITHDLGVVAGMVDRVLVMYAGRAVEKGTVDDVFYRPRMPYSIGLLGSMPRVDAGDRQRLTPIKGSPAVADQPAAGLPVRAALPAALREVRRAGAGAAPGRRRRAQRRLHPGQRAGRDRRRAGGHLHRRLQRRDAGGRVGDRRVGAGRAGCRRRRRGRRAGCPPSRAHPRRGPRTARRDEEERA